MMIMYALPYPYVRCLLQAIRTNKCAATALRTEDISSNRLIDSFRSKKLSFSSPTTSEVDIFTVDMTKIFACSPVDESREKKLAASSVSLWQSKDSVQHLRQGLKRFSGLRHSNSISSSNAFLLKEASSSNQFKRQVSSEVHDSDECKAHPLSIIVLPTAELIDMSEFVMNSVNKQPRNNLCIFIFTSMDLIEPLVYCLKTGLDKYLSNLKAKMRSKLSSSFSLSPSNFEKGGSSPNPFSALFSSPSSKKERHLVSLQSKSLDWQERDEIWSSRIPPINRGLSLNLSSASVDDFQSGHRHHHRSSFASRINPTHPITIRRSLIVNQNDNHFISSVSQDSDVLFPPLQLSDNTNNDVLSTATPNPTNPKSGQSARPSSSAERRISDFFNVDLAATELNVNPLKLKANSTSFSKNSKASSIRSGLVLDIDEMNGGESLSIHAIHREIHRIVHDFRTAHADNVIVLF